MQYINKATVNITNQFEHANGVFWSAEITIGEKVICTVEQRGNGGVNFYYARTPEWKKCKQEIIGLFAQQASPYGEDELIDAVVTFTDNNQTLEQGFWRYCACG